MSILTKIFGSKSDREIKKILPTVKEVNQFYDSLENKDIAFLKQRTKELQAIIKQAIDDQESKKLKNLWRNFSFAINTIRISAMTIKVQKVK